MIECHNKDVCSSMDTETSDYGVIETKKDVNVSIGYSFVRMAGTSRKSTYVAAESARELKVGFESSTHMVKGDAWHCHMRYDIVEMYKMVKGIRPELGRKIGAKEHHIKGVTNGLTFTKAILI